MEAAEVPEVPDNAMRRQAEADADAKLRHAKAEADADAKLRQAEVDAVASHSYPSHTAA